jgi:hypothetical protein
MAKQSAKNAIIQVDDSGGTARNISTDCVTFDIEDAVDPLEVTGFTQGFKNNVPGIKTKGITLEVRYNSAATTGAFTVLRGILGQSSSVTVSVQPEGSGLAYSGEFMLDALPVKGSVDGLIEVGTVHFSPMGSTAPDWA